MTAITDGFGPGKVRAEFSVDSFARRVTSWKTILIHPLPKHKGRVKWSPNSVCRQATLIDASPSTRALVDPSCHLRHE